MNDDTRTPSAVLDRGAEQSVREQSVREQSVRERSVREQSVREQSVRERSVSASTVREQARREQTEREQGLARELGGSALLLGLSFAVTAAVVTVAQAAASLLG